MKLIDQALMSKETLESVEEDLTHFLSFLQGPKFTGVESDGSRKDWISTGDVIPALRAMRSKLQEAREQMTVVRKENNED